MSFSAVVSSCTLPWHEAQADWPSAAWTLAGKPWPHPMAGGGIGLFDNLGGMGKL